MRQPSSSTAPSIIGSDVRIVGNVTTAGELQLDGIVEGDVDCGAVTLGEHGTVTGVVTADNLVVRGKIEGKIRAKTVRLESSAKVVGDVFHETVSIEAGAHIDGKFVHGDQGGKRAKENIVSAPKGDANSKGQDKPNSTSATQDSAAKSGNGQGVARQSL